MAIPEREEIIAQRHYPEDIQGSAHDLYIASPVECAQYVADQVVAEIEQPGRPVAEFCCGVGITLIELAKRGAYVTGVDISSECLAAAATNLQQAGISNEQYRLVQADLGDWYAYTGIQADVALYDIPNWYDGLEANPDYSHVVSNILGRVASKLVISAPPIFRVQPQGVSHDTLHRNGKVDRKLIYYGFNERDNQQIDL